MKKYLFLLLMAPLSLWGQKSYDQSNEFLNRNKVWIIGQNTGLDFNVNPPTSFTTNSSIPNANDYEGLSAACDPKTGELLFYTNGSYIWDKNGVLMPNGSALGGNISGSTQQGSCIVPVIGDTTGKRFYVFSMYEPLVTQLRPKKTLVYHIVDMRLNNGLGDVDPNFYNIQIDTSFLAECMIAVPGCNNDVWLVTYKGDDETVVADIRTEYRVYHISVDGINLNPVVSKGKANACTKTNPGAGKFAISPDRSFIALNHTVIFDFPLAEVAQFNIETGELTDFIELDMSAGGYKGGLGCSFSPNSKKLYLDLIDIMNFSSRIVQFDLSNYDSTSIALTRTLLNETFDLSPDFKLYNDTLYFMAGIFTPGGSIHAITNPDESVSNLNVIKDAIPLKAGNYALQMPNYTVTPYKYFESTKFDTLICSSEITEYKLMATHAGDDFTYKWSTGATTSSILITQPGTYWVEASKNCDAFVDTFIVQLDLLTKPEITVSKTTLSTVEDYNSYQWLLNGKIIENATNKTYEVTQNGNYQVVVSNNGICIDTSDVYTITNAVSIDNIHESTIQLYPNPTTGIVHVHLPESHTLKVLDLKSRVLLESNQAVLNLKNIPNGTYIIGVYNQEGGLIGKSLLSKID